MQESNKCFFEMSEEERKRRCERYAEIGCHFRGMGTFMGGTIFPLCHHQWGFRPHRMWYPCRGVGRTVFNVEERSQLRNAFFELLHSEEGRKFCEVIDKIREQRVKKSCADEETWGCEKRRAMCPHYKADSAPQEKPEGSTRIAVPYEDGNIRQSFGGVQEFKIYDVADKKMVSEKIIDNGGAVHADLVHFLVSQGVDVVICDNIGSNGYDFFLKNNIKIYVGAKGGADQAVQAYLDGTLDLSKEPAGCGNGCGNSDNYLG